MSKVVNSHQASQLQRMLGCCNMQPQEGNAGLATIDDGAAEAGGEGHEAGHRYCKFAGPWRVRRRYDNAAA